MMAKLNPQQIKFIDAYLEGASATTAVIVAGYKCSGAAARVQGNRLLNMAHVKKEIERKQKKSEIKINISRELILTGLLDIFANADKSNDRVQAAAQINKMQGYYASEKIEHEHSGQISVVVELPNNNRRTKDAS